MKRNAFRTMPPASRYQAGPAKIHATPRKKPSFWTRFKGYFVRRRDQIATELALAGLVYMVGRFATGMIANKRLADLAAFGTLIALIMLVTAVLISIQSGKDNHRIN